MPEGDTVWNTARVLRRALVGGRVTAVDFRVPHLATVGLAPQPATTDNPLSGDRPAADTAAEGDPAADSPAADSAASGGLVGWTVLESTSRGKHLLLRFGRPGGTPAATGGNPAPERLTLHSHLRMDGSWRVYAPGQRWAAKPAHLIRVVLRTADAVAVGYHLHDLALVSTAEEETLVGHLGPDLLGPDWDPVEAARRLAAHPDTPIGEALLQQRNLAGIGNLYKAEVLFLRGVWPWTPVRRVRDLDALVRLAQRLLAANRGRWTQSTTGSLRRGETTHVYGRRGRPCRRCGTPIRVAGGDAERVTYWCPTCQPEPDALPVHHQP